MELPRIPERRAMLGTVPGLDPSSLPLGSGPDTLRTPDGSAHNPELWAARRARGQAVGWERAEMREPASRCGVEDLAELSLLLEAP